MWGRTNRRDLQLCIHYMHMVQRTYKNVQVPYGSVISGICHIISYHNLSSLVTKLPHLISRRSSKKDSLILLCCSYPQLLRGQRCDSLVWQRKKSAVYKILSRNYHSAINLRWKYGGRHLHLKHIRLRDPLTPTEWQVGGGGCHSGVFILSRNIFSYVTRSIE